MPKDRTRALLEFMYHVSHELASALDLHTVLNRVLYEAIQNVGGERGSIVVLDDDGKPLDAAILFGKQFHDHTTQQMRDTIKRGLAGWVIRNRQPVLIKDTSDDPRWLQRPDDAIEKTGPKSAICVPLLARERLVGVLTLVYPVPNAYGSEHLDVMQAIADQAGIAVLNARLYSESQRQARVMTALAKGAVSITASLHLDEVMQRILNQTIQALQVETVALALVESPGGDLVFRAATGQNARKILKHRVPAGQGIIGIVAREGQGVVIPEVEEDKRLAETDRFAGIELHAITLAPIQAQGRLIGILEAINPVSGSFDPDALLVMTGIGGLAGTTIQNAQLFERLQVAHERYRELFEDSIEPILITNWEGKILEANRPAISLSGYDRKKIRSISIDQIHAVNWDETGVEFASLKTNEMCKYESMLHKHQGGDVPIEVYVRRVQFEEADSLQWILRDISERKQLDSLRDDLSAMVYHDLRSPLSNIASSLEVLSGIMSSQDNDTVRSLIAIAVSSTTRIQSLVNSLLDINRLEAGQAIVTQQAVDPAVLVEDALKAVAQTTGNRNQIVQSHIPTNLPLIWVDADMIRRVLNNLIENAIKFSPIGGKIEIGAEAKDDWVQMWVQDNGPGIPTADQDRIFDKFSRIKTRVSPSGFGIGLAFCRLAVQGHGGRIWVESQSEMGSRFYITLPTIKPGQTI